MAWLMAQRNRAREIALSLALGLVFAGGLFAYIMSGVKRPTPSLLVPSSEGAGHVYTRGDDARRVGSAFVQQLSMAHHEEAYRLMAGAYRQTTPFSAFQSACIGSPFLSTAQSVSLGRTSETVAPGQDKGALSATGVMTTGAGAVEVKFAFVDDVSGLGIVNVIVAGTPAFAMGALAVPAPSAPTAAAKSAVKPAKKP
jgi:hypothetical protein